MLIKNGFRGPIWCSSSTADLSEFFCRIPAFSRRRTPTSPIGTVIRSTSRRCRFNTERDARKALASFKIVSFDAAHVVDDGVKMVLRRTGHILGAASIELQSEGTTIVFSGDLGRYDDPIFHDPAPVGVADYLVVESTYGDRQHDRIDPEAALADIVSRTVGRGGTVVIPSFAVGRAQSLMFHIQRLKAAGLLNNVPVFLDSPMAVDASEVFCRNVEDHRLPEAECRTSCAVATYVRSTEDSKALTANPMPKIIISASGMATGGRVLHHLKRFAPEPKNTILFAGFSGTGDERSLDDGGSAVGADSRRGYSRARRDRQPADALCPWRCRRDPAMVPRLSEAAADDVRDARRASPGEALSRRLEQELGWRMQGPGSSGGIQSVMTAPASPAATGSLRHSHPLKAKRLGIDTHQEAVVYMRADCHVCRSEGLTPQSRVLLRNDSHEVMATLHHVAFNLLDPNEAGLSEAAWQRLGINEGDYVYASHPSPVESLSSVGARIYGNRIDAAALDAIISDVVKGRYSDIQLSSFITACAALPLDEDETVALTRAMVNVGERLLWPDGLVLDKHSIGGLPGNRTTPIVVSIVAAHGLTMPKTSSRAITSPAGTADTMETMAPVDLDLSAIRRVVELEGGCVVWGGAVRLSPADDILIRIERALEVDSEGQLVASVLSKKIAAGSTHLVLDVPVGPTAKVRSAVAAQALSERLSRVAAVFGLTTEVVLSDGQQPVGRGIGPALEAHDVLAVLQNRPGASTILARDPAISRACCLKWAAHAPRRGIEIGHANAGRRPCMGKVSAHMRGARRHANATGRGSAPSADRCDGRHDRLDRQSQDRKTGQAGRSAGNESGGRRTACSTGRSRRRRATDLRRSCQYARRAELCPRLRGGKSGHRRDFSPMTGLFVIPMPGNEAVAAAIANKLGAPLGALQTRSFPDGETYLRFEQEPKGLDVILVCSMDRPDPKFLPLVFAAHTARNLGAVRVALVAPYLCYMRQDKRFHVGEAVTSVSFARLVSAAFDCLVTVDPHLHRHRSLADIYSIPTSVVHSAGPVADWIAQNERDPLLIGPDIESEQWVSEVAVRIGAPYRVLRKERLGDRNVKIMLPDLHAFRSHTPILIDDIVSSGRTMIESAQQLRAQGFRAPTCIAVHALLSSAAYRSLIDVAGRVVSTNTVPHGSNGIEVADLLATATAQLLTAGQGT